jgi:hypothetical protein
MSNVGIQMLIELTKNEQDSKGANNGEDHETQS